jgi:threonine synthase
VKALFQHPRFADEVRLSGVNSINWARVAAQALPALHLRHPAMRVEDEHVDVVEAAERLDGGAAGIARMQLGDNLFLLELHHGPTLAFKDVAMQLLGRLMDPPWSSAGAAPPTPGHAGRG